MRLKIIYKAWGDGYDKLSPPLSALEGAKEEYAETVIHELCHAMLLGLTPAYGNCNETILPEISKRLGEDGLPLILRELHEVHALGAEYIVLKELKVRVSLSTLAYFGYRNLEAKDADDCNVKRLILKAAKTRASQQAAAGVVRFLTPPT